jgi:3-deoxy-7-phosphoheptulonate synthase
VAENLANQILEGNRSLVGFMLESHLNWGNQPMVPDRNKLQYGVSVTDACIDWDTTQKLLLRLDERLRSAPRFAKGSVAA